MKPIDIATANYIAAFCDGEAHLGVHGHKNSSTPTIKVVIVNTHLATLKFIQQHIGGHLGPKKGRADHQPAYQLQLRRHELPRFIKEICPYLRTKAGQGMLIASAYAQSQAGWTKEAIERIHMQAFMLKPHRLEQPTLEEQEINGPHTGTTAKVLPLRA